MKSPPKDIVRVGFRNKNLRTRMDQDRGPNLLLGSEFGSSFMQVSGLGSGRVGFVRLLTHTVLGNE